MSGNESKVPQRTELGAGPATVVRLTDAKRRVLNSMAALGKPATIVEIAKDMMVHPNTVRQQLSMLVNSGHVVKQKAADHQRGRPAQAYRLAVDVNHVIGQDDPVDPLTEEYLGLTGAFAEYLSRTNASPAAEARVIGRMWGRSLLKMNKTPKSATPRAQVIALFDRMGFSPRQSKRDENLVLLRTCPLINEAQRHPEVICQVHIGVAEGALEALGASYEGVNVIPFAAPGACHLTIPLPQENA